MPTGQQFQEAVQNPELNFADAELKQGEPVLNELGLPKPISGNFASVFTFDCSHGKRYAVKCFFTTLTCVTVTTRFTFISSLLTTHGRFYLSTCLKGSVWPEVGIRS